MVVFSREQDDQPLFHSENEEQVCVRRTIEDCWDPIQVSV